ncbi:hypothetical protein ACFS5N_01580 [Mucilaginibacter ximonensis]|uniref:DUF4142 domain-containing protein n=1 Tax=Mucilaginibacter ximonensis TaxID=538021 RepID=A0ABW5Y733_9SPHI
MKKILLLLTFVLITQTNFASTPYSRYLHSWNLVSKLCSELTDNADAIAHRPDRIAIKAFAVNFNRKVGILIVNQNNLINLITHGGFKDHHFPNTYRIMQQNLADIKKILLDNRPFFDNLKINSINTVEVYSPLDFKAYENDELLRQATQNRRNKAFKHNVIDNLTQGVILLNECRSKVAALYSKIK